MMVMNKLISFAKKHKVLSAIILLFIGLTVFSAVKLSVEEPRDLGPNLQYIGKHNTACEWWQVPFYAGFCGGPQYDYYFATNMNRDEIKGYFQKAQYNDPRSESYSKRNLDFNRTDGAGDFHITFFDSMSELQKLKGVDFKVNGYAHIISIPDFDYPIAKEAL